MTTRRSVIALLASAPALFALGQPVFASSKPPVFQKDGVAINGFDPVAYFTQSAPVEGSSEYTVDYMGAEFRFATAENADLFKANPEAYAPQYGGYCAYAVSKGGTAKTDPDAWTVYDGKLYLNFNRTVRGIWGRDIPGNIAKADANWPDVLDA